jgi:hypothetical protein
MFNLLTVNRLKKRLSSKSVRPFGVQPVPKRYRSKLILNFVLDAIISVGKIIYSI